MAENGPTDNQASARKREGRKRLSASLEDYLEAIYWLVEEHDVARVSQIARALGVSKSSVTGALKHLAAKGYIDHDPYQFIKLNPSGESVAKEIVWRHKVLTRFMVEVLDVDEDRADESACKLEHQVDKVVLDRLLEFVQFVNGQGMEGRNWAELFAEFRDRDDNGELCPQCRELESLRHSD